MSEKLGATDREAVLERAIRSLLLALVQADLERGILPTKDLASAADTAAKLIGWKKS